MLCAKQSSGSLLTLDKKLKPENMSLDVLGIKPVGESVSTITKGGVDGAGAFLSRICLPAAEEYGFYLRDKIRSWRSKNMEKLVINAELLVVDRISKKLNAHPRVVHDILKRKTGSKTGSVLDIDM